jgi:hypothetical protein
MKLPTTSSWQSTHRPDGPTITTILVLRSFGDVGSTSGLPESGHRRAIYGPLRTGDMSRVTRNLQIVAHRRRNGLAIEAIRVRIKQARLDQYFQIIGGELKQDNKFAVAFAFTTATLAKGGGIRWARGRSGLSFGFPQHAPRA